MATNEASFRRELVRDFAAHGHTVTISQRFLAGVPDLYIKLPGLPAFWLELKYVDKPNKRGTIPVDLTTLQRHFLTREQQAGGFAGWAVGTPCRSGWRAGWQVFAGHDPEARVVTNLGPAAQRRVGQAWDVKAIAEKILTRSVP